MKFFKIRILTVLVLVCTAFVPGHVWADANGGDPNSPTVGYQKSLTVGYNHSCAVLSDHTMKCWGSNQYGQLGNSSISDSHTPTLVSGLAENVTVTSAGAYHSCAVLASAALKCWGYNASGQLGDGSTTDRLTPTQVTGLTNDVVAVSAADSNTCALLSTGGVQCWGFNTFGQLGDGSTTDRLTPVQVSGLSSGVAAISSGTYHSCALLSTGGVKCWGYNYYGQLGDGSTVSSSAPVQVSGLSSGVAAISSGTYHSCALLSTGGVKCWGYNTFGQLGDGSTTDRLTPVQVSGLSSGVTAISSGTYHPCALLSTGGVKCWGNNAYGQLGDGSTTDRWVPTQVSGFSSGVTAIALGESDSCALLSTGGVKCWGYNFFGQLGDGSTTNRWTPVQVSGLSSGVGPTTTTTTIPLQTNNSVASSPTTTTTTTVAAKVQPKFKAKGTMKFSKIAAYAGVTVKAGSKVLVLVKPSSAKVCAVKAGQLVAIKKGTCAFTFSVATTAKGKTTTKRTAVRLVVS